MVWEFVHEEAIRTVVGIVSEACEVVIVPDRGRVGTFLDGVRRSRNFKDAATTTSSNVPEFQMIRYSRKTSSIRPRGKIR